jgi:hypothetical protein
LLNNISSKCLDSLVELPWVLSDSVLHFEVSVEGADEDEVFGHADAGAPFVLSYGQITFFK